MSNRYVYEVDFVHIFNSLEGQYYWWQYTLERLDRRKCQGLRSTIPDDSLWWISTRHLPIKIRLIFGKHIDNQYLKPKKAGTPCVALSKTRRRLAGPCKSYCMNPGDNPLSNTPYPAPAPHPPSSTFVPPSPRAIKSRDAWLIVKRVRRET